MKKLLQKIIILAIILSPLSSSAVGFVTTGGASFANPAFPNQAKFHGSASGSAGTLSGAQNLLVNFGYARTGSLLFGSTLPDPKSCKELAKSQSYQVTPQQKLVAGTLPEQFSADSSPNLQPNSIYWYCAIAQDDGFPNYINMGEPKKFTTKAGLINTSAVTEITENSATLNGVIATPTSKEWHVNFRYQDKNWKNGGCEHKYSPFTGQLIDDNLFTDFITVNKGFSGAGEFKQKLVGLNPGTTYYVCAVISTAKNGVGYAYGEVVSFKTLGINTKGVGTKVDSKNSSSGPRPDEIGGVSTYENKYAGDTSALISGNVTRLKGSGYAYFRFSTFRIPPIFCNDIYGNDKADIEAYNDLANPVLGGKIREKEASASSSLGDFHAIVNDLTPDTEYYYCAVVSNSAKNNATEIEYGGVQKLRTAPCRTCDKIKITTNPPRDILSTSTSLQGHYTTNVSLVTYFEYKENVGGGAVGTIFGAGSTLTNTDWLKAKQKDNHKANTYGKVNYTLTGLKQDTEYFVRLVGEPTSGALKIVYGETLRFKTKVGSDIFNKGGPTEEKEIPGVNVDPGVNGNPTVIGPKRGPVTPDNPCNPIDEPCGPGVNPDPGNPDNPDNPNNGNPNNGNPNNGNPNNPNNGNPSNPNNNNLNLGTVATPPNDAIVRYREGVETVFQRQIVRNTDIANYYGYESGNNLESFAWTLAHELATEFGYVDGKGREIRVSRPDVSAYEIRLNGNGLTVYEYYKDVIIDIRVTSFSFKIKNQYEYYFNKILKFFR